MYIFLYIVPFLFLSMKPSEWKKHFSSKYKSKREEELLSSFSYLPNLLRSFEMERYIKVYKKEKFMFLIDQFVRLIIGFLFDSILYIVIYHSTSYNSITLMIGYILLFLIFLVLILALNDFNYGVFKLAFPYHINLFRRKMSAYLKFNHGKKMGKE